MADELQVDDLNEEDIGRDGVDIAGDMGTELLEDME